ncbi:MAG: hypothetical protein AAGE52_29455 [Myxococcota bacterium]
MSRRTDVLKSWFRAGADRAAQRLDQVAPIAMARRFVRELRDQRTTVSDKDLTRAVAHVSVVESASITARRGGLHVDVSFVDAPDLSCTLTPIATRFAPRGAKEVVFRVTPREAQRHRGLRDVTSAIAGSIAHQLWAIALAKLREEDISGAIVDRDGDECMRVDLRTVPAVRDAVRQRTGAMVIELLELRELSVVDGALSLSVRLPGLTP